MDRGNVAVIAVVVYAVARVVYLGGTLVWISVMRDEQTPVSMAIPCRKVDIFFTHATSSLKIATHHCCSVLMLLITTALPCNRFALLRIQRKNRTLLPSVVQKEAKYRSVEGEFGINARKVVNCEALTHSDRSHRTACLCVCACQQLLIDAPSTHALRPNHDQLMTRDYPV